MGKARAPELVLAGMATLVAVVAALLPRAVADAPLAPRPGPEYGVVDLHVDTIFHALTAGRTIAGAAGKGDLDAARLVAGGYVAQFFAIWVPAKVDAEGPGASAAWAERAYVAYEKLIAGAAPTLERATTAADVERIRKAGHVAAILSIEGAHALGDRVEALDPWAARGLRLLGLAWNNSNAFAEAAADPRPAAPGLTPLGRALVARAESLGVLLDVSHASRATFWDVVKMARRPVVASHSDCAALRAIPRNLDDDQLRAIAASGGVVGINFHAPFVSKKKPVTIDDVVAHVLHAVKVAGPEHVAMGSDFDGLITKPKGLEDAARMPELARKLVARGLSPETVTGIMGGNALRVLAAPAKD